VAAHPSRDVVLVLAFFGGAVAAVSGASGELGLAFLALGLLTAGIRPALALARRGLRRFGIMRRERRGPLEGHAKPSGPSRARESLVNAGLSGGLPPRAGP